MWQVGNLFTFQLSPVRDVPGSFRGLAFPGRVRATVGGLFQELSLPARLPKVIDVDTVLDALRRPLGR